MKSALRIAFTLFFFSSLYSQTAVDTTETSAVLTPDQCFDVIKKTWDGLKKISEDFKSQIDVKSEFESTTEFNERVRKSKDQFANKVQKYSADQKLGGKMFSVWMKAELTKYDADNQIYSVKSPTQILVQPKKEEIAIACPSNKYVSLTEKNEQGYRRAYIHLNTEPNFSWFVNKVTAQAAKNKESQIYFKLSFTMEVSVNETDDQIVLTIVPHKLSLLNQSENFTYWSEDIR
ncbi:MAG: hypothetical protein PHP42_07950 [Bacteroidota bacterium]|nr:hypothetical protein [Bacteroidota bacterium]